MFRVSIRESLFFQPNADLVLSVDSVKKFFSDATTGMKCYKKGDQTHEVDTALDAYCPIGKNEKFTSLINGLILQVFCDENEEYTVTLDDVVKFTKVPKHASREFVAGRHIGLVM